MALQVWLPLNGSLKNQGLSSVTLTEVNGSSTFAPGKIGQGLSCNGSKNIRINGVTLGTTASICCWSKTSTASRMMWVLDCVSSDRLNVYTSSIYTLNTGDSNNNPFKDDSGNNISVLTDNVWHHFVVTFDGTQSKLYIDGTYRGKAKTYKSPAMNASHKTIKIAGDYNGTHTYDWNGMLDDFRVYDHCLSPKEVKEIAKGLVLHYKLEKVYAKLSNDTLIYSCLPRGLKFYEYLQSDGSQWINTGYAPNDASGIYLRAYCTTSGGNYQAIGCRQTSGNTRWWINYSTTLELSWNVWTGTATGYTNTWTEVEHNYFNNRSAKVNGTSYSVSYPTLATITQQAYLFNSNNSGNPGAGFKGRISSAKITEGETLIRDFIPAQYNDKYGMWDLVEGKFYENLGTGSFTAGPELTISYLPAYDCSGYGNDGTVTGTLTTDEISSRYSNSTVFNGTDSLIKAEPLPLETKTVSFWANTSWVSSSGYRIVFADKQTYLAAGWSGSTLIVGANSSSIAGTVFNITSSSYTANKWNHIVVIKTSDTGRDVYINGEKLTPSSGTNYWTMVSDELYVGARNNGTPNGFFNGKLSDFRVYATALSGDDIKELYNTSAFLTNNGTMYGYELKEAETSKFNKNGVIETGDFIESNLTTEKMKVFEDEIQANTFNEI